MDIKEPSTIYAFLSDIAFVDQYSAGHAQGEVSGIGKLTQRGASYFVDLQIEVNPRTPNTRPISWVGETRSKLFIDKYWYSGFISIFEGTTVEEQQSLFDILDYLFFSESPDKETYLSTNASTKIIYISNSLKNNIKTVTDSYYLESNLSKQNKITTNTYRTFKIRLSKGTDTYQYQIIVYADGTAWESEYPNSKILSTSPPVSYHDLLYMDFVNDVSNKLGTATETVSIVNSNIGPGNINTDVPTAALTHGLELHDALGNIASALFTVLYKGNVPTESQINDAIRDDVINSGVGSEDEWKDRIPGLFVKTRFYIVPFWDNTFVYPDATLALGHINLSASSEKLQYILPNVDLSIFDDRLDYMVSGYNRMLCAAVPDAISPSDVAVVQPFSKVVTQYFGYSSAEANFNYMDTLGQKFARNLTNILVMLNENKANPQYSISNARTLQFVSFVIDTIEFCVITPKCFTDSLEGIQA